MAFLSNNEMDFLRREVPSEVFEQVQNVPKRPPCFDKAEEDDSCSSVGMNLVGWYEPILKCQQDHALIMMRPWLALHPSCCVLCRMRIAPNARYLFHCPCCKFDICGCCAMEKVKKDSNGKAELKVSYCGALHPPLLKTDECEKRLIAPVPMWGCPGRPGDNDCCVDDCCTDACCKGKRKALKKQLKEMLVGFSSLKWAVLPGVSSSKLLADDSDSSDSYTVFSDDQTNDEKNEYSCRKTPTKEDFACCCVEDEKEEKNKTNSSEEVDKENAEKNTSKWEEFNDAPDFMKRRQYYRMRQKKKYERILNKFEREQYPTERPNRHSLWDSETLNQYFRWRYQRMLQRNLMLDARAFGFPPEELLRTDPLYCCEEPMYPFPQFPQYHTQAWDGMYPMMPYEFQRGPFPQEMYPTQRTQSYPFHPELYSQRGPFPQEMCQPARRGRSCWSNRRRD